MKRSIVVSVAIVAAIGALLVLELGDHSSRTETSPADVGNLTGVVNPAVTQANIGDTICP
jgi:hypothetical protein